MSNTANGLRTAVAQEQQEAGKPDSPPAAAPVAQRRRGQLQLAVADASLRSNTPASTATAAENSFATPSIAAGPAALGRSNARSLSQAAAGSQPRCRVTPTSSADPRSTSTVTAVGSGSSLFAAAELVASGVSSLLLTHLGSAVAGPGSAPSQRPIKRSATAAAAMDVHRGLPARVALNSAKNSADAQPPLRPSLKGGQSSVATAERPSNNNAQQQAGHNKITVGTAAAAKSSSSRPRVVTFAPGTKSGDGSSSDRKSHSGDGAGGEKNASSLRQLPPLARIRGTSAAGASHVPSNASNAATEDQQRASQQQHPQLPQTNPERTAHAECLGCHRLFSALSAAGLCSRCGSTHSPDSATPHATSTQVGPEHCSVPLQRPRRSYATGVQSTEPILSDLLAHITVQQLRMQLAGYCKQQASTGRSESKEARGGASQDNETVAASSIAAASSSDIITELLRQVSPGQTQVSLRAGAGGMDYEQKATEESDSSAKKSKAPRAAAIPTKSKAAMAAAAAASPSRPQSAGGSAASEDLAKLLFLQLADPFEPEYLAPLSATVWNNWFKDRVTPYSDTLGGSALAAVLAEWQDVLWEQLREHDEQLYHLLLDHAEKASSVKQVVAVLGSRGGCKGAEWRQSYSQWKAPSRKVQLLWAYFGGVQPSALFGSIFEMHCKGFWHGKHNAEAFDVIHPRSGTTVPAAAAAAAAAAAPTSPTSRAKKPRVRAGTNKGESGAASGATNRRKRRSESEHGGAEESSQKKSKVDSEQSREARRAQNATAAALAAPTRSLFPFRDFASFMRHELLSLFSLSPRADSTTSVSYYSRPSSFLPFRRCYSDSTLASNRTIIETLKQILQPINHRLQQNHDPSGRASDSTPSVASVADAESNRPAESRAASVVAAAPVSSPVLELDDDVNMPPQEPQLSQAEGSTRMDIDGEDPMGAVVQTVAAAGAAAGSALVNSSAPTLALPSAPATGVSPDADGFHSAPIEERRR